MSHSPEISIIIPVYNQEKSRDFVNLIEDIRSQTFIDWELLLCDDGSEDNTLEICYKFSQNDSRIKVIESKHKGVSATRNNGIKSAKGEWITFVDSDDRLLCGFLMAMIEKTKCNHQTQLIVGSFAIAHSNLELFIYDEEDYSQREELQRFFLTTKFLHRCSVWAKFFRRSIVQENKIYFQEHITHSEDRIFMYEYLIQISNISTSSYLGYVYGSFSSTSLKNKLLPVEMTIERQLTVTKSALLFCDRYNIDISKCKYVALNLANLLIVTLENLLRQKRIYVNYKQIETSLLGEYLQSDTYKSIIKNPELSQYRPISQLTEILNKGINRFNRRFIRKEILLKVKRKLNHLLWDNKNTIYGYSRFIKYINR